MSTKTMQACIHTNDKKYSFSTIKAPKSQITHRTKPNNNALGKRIWDEPTIYWKRESGYEWIEDKYLDNMIKLAFLEASIETPLVIRKKNRNMSDAHIVVNFLGKKDEPYFKSPSTLAYGYGPGSGIGGDITMNSDVLWLLRNTPLTAEEAKELGYIDNYSNPDNEIKYYDPLHTMKHEGGHALGMNHIETDPRATMYPYYNGSRRFNTSDVGYLQDLYGMASINHKIKETLIQRVLGYFR